MAQLDDDLHGVTGSDTRDVMEGYQWRRLGVVVIGCGFIVFMIGDFHGEEMSADPVVSANVLLITIEALAIVAAFLDFGQREAAHGASGHRNSPGAEVQVTPGAVLKPKLVRGVPVSMALEDRKSVV